MSNNIKRIWKTSKETNAILREAAGTMIRSSFQTTKQLVGLYRKAGFQTFDLGKEIVKKTFELGLDNQKQLLRTSGEAIKEIGQSIRSNITTPEPQPKAKKGQAKTKTSRAKKPQKEVTIDDLLNQN